MRFQDLLRQRSDKFFIFRQSRIMLFIETARDTVLNQFPGRWLFAAGHRAMLIILQLPKAVTFETPERHIGAILRALRSKTFKKAVELIAHFQTIIEHTAVAALVICQHI